MARIKMHIPKAKLPFYPPCEVKCRLQNGVSTPYKIVSDNGTLFINKEVRAIIKYYKIKHQRLTSYYLQGNGQAEATNKVLLGILSKMVFD